MILWSLRVFTRTSRTDTSEVRRASILLFIIQNPLLTLSIALIFALPVGHMGVTVVNPERGDMEKIIKGIQDSFAEAGYKVPSGSA